MTTRWSCPGSSPLGEPSTQPPGDADAQLLATILGRGKASRLYERSCTRAVRSGSLAIRTAGPGFCVRDRRAGAARAHHGRAAARRGRGAEAHREQGPTRPTGFRTDPDLRRHRALAGRPGATRRAADAISGRRDHARCAAARFWGATKRRRATGTQPWRASSWLRAVVVEVVPEGGAKMRAPLSRCSHSPARPGRSAARARRDLAGPAPGRARGAGARARVRSPFPRSRDGPAHRDPPQRTSAVRGGAARAGIEAIQLWIRGGATTDPEASPGLASLTAEADGSGRGGKVADGDRRCRGRHRDVLSVNALQDAVVVSGSALTVSLEPMPRCWPTWRCGRMLSSANGRSARPAEAMLLAERAEPAVRSCARPRRRSSRPLRSAPHRGHPSRRAADDAGGQVRATYASFGPRQARRSSPSVARILPSGGGAAVRVRRVAGRKARAARSKWRNRRASVPARVRRFFPESRSPSCRRAAGGSAVVAGHLALEVLNAVVGGSFTSRLNQNLREQHGYSYWASSRFEWTLARSPFSARSS